ncbi:MAG: 50S ribosomal protein L10 [candidate division Zixibacteria bacterium]|nr:50S ribosomal protein L10 [candidate division Zixibacteria bacterium]
MPSAAKIEAVAEIKKLFKGSSSLFVTDYQGLNVADMTVLRKDLRENNVKFFIGKNTLLKIAAKESGVEGLDEHLIGPTAIAFTADDPAVAARILHKSFKDRELPRMKVFLVDNKVFAGGEIKRLADLPTKEVLYSMVVAAVESPLTELVGTLDGVFRKLVGTVDALAEKRKSEE